MAPWTPAASRDEPDHELRSCPMPENPPPPNRPPARPVQVPGGRALLLALLPAACAPALDWRSVQMPDTELVAQLPCRPGRFERTVAVADLQLRMFMLSCEADGVTYGVASAEVPDP